LDENGLKHASGYVFYQSMDVTAAFHDTAANNQILQANFWEELSPMVCLTMLKTIEKFKLKKKPSDIWLLNLLNGEVYTEKEYKSPPFAKKSIQMAGSRFK